MGKDIPGKCQSKERWSNCILIADKVYYSKETVFNKDI